jgi:hypothetical protein
MIDTALALCGAIVAAGCFAEDAALAAAVERLPMHLVFTDHFPLAFYPFQRVRDADGVDWWADAREASLASKAWCADQAGTWRTFAVGLWGPAAGLGPNGYVVDGARPALMEPHAGVHGGVSGEFCGAVERVSAPGRRAAVARPEQRSRPRPMTTHPSAGCSARRSRRRPRRSA